MLSPEFINDLEINKNPNEVEKFHNHKADMRIHTLTVHSPTQYKDAFIQFFRVQNFLYHQYAVRPHRVDPLTYLYRKYHKGTWDENCGVRKVELIKDNDHVSVDEANTALKDMLDVLNYKVQNSLHINGFELKNDALIHLLGKIKNQPLTELSFINTKLNSTLLLDSLSKNYIKTKYLNLENSLGDEDPQAIVDALAKNFFVEDIEIKGPSLSNAQKKKITEIEMRNEWLHNILKNNSFETLKYRSETMPSWKCDAVTYLIKEGGYKKIEIPNANPSTVQLEQWIEAARVNDRLTHLIFNEDGCEKNLTQELQRQLNINRSIKKTFGRGNPLFARSSTMYGFVGFNFFQSFVAAIAPAYALVGGVLGGLMVGGMRALSNALYKRALHKTKENGYWDNQANREAYESGRECAKAWSPWFGYKSWTTPGYLGHIQAKNQMEPAITIAPTRPSA